MLLRSKIFWVFIFLAVATQSSSKKKKQSVDIPKWTYGEDKEKSWPKQCSKGYQSPINLPAVKEIKKREDGIKVEWDEDITLEGFNFFSRWLEWKPAGSRKNAGHIELDGTKYYLRNITVHRKSEHAILGARSLLELQFLHTTSLHSDAKIAIVSILTAPKDKIPSVVKNFYKVLENNFKFGPNQIKEKEDRDSKKPKTLDLKEFAKTVGKQSSNGKSVAFKRYYSYKGSLTHPPCTTGVKWIILNSTIPVESNFRNFLDEGKNKDTRGAFRQLQERGSKRYVWVSDEDPEKKEKEEKRKKEKEMKKKPAKPKSAPKEVKDKAEKKAPKVDKKPPADDDSSKEKDEDKTLDDEESDKNDDSSKKDSKSGKKKDAARKEDENDSDKKADKEADGDDSESDENEDSKSMKKKSAGKKEDENDSDSKADKEADGDDSESKDTKNKDEDADKSADGEGDKRKDGDSKKDVDKDANEDDEKSKDGDSKKDADEEDDDEESKKEESKKSEEKKNESKEDKKDSDSDEDDEYLPNDKEDTPCDHFTEKGCKDVAKRCEVKEGKCVSKAQLFSESATSAKHHKDLKRPSFTMPSDAEIMKQVEDDNAKERTKKETMPDFDGDYLVDDENDLANDENYDVDDGFFEVQATLPNNMVYFTIISLLSLILILAAAVWCMTSARKDHTSYRRIVDFEEI